MAVVFDGRKNSGWCLEVHFHTMDSKSLKCSLWEWENWNFQCWNGYLLASVLWSKDRWVKLKCRGFIEWCDGLKEISGLSFAVYLIYYTISINVVFIKTYFLIRFMQNFKGLFHNWSHHADEGQKIISHFLAFTQFFLLWAVFIEDSGCL